MHKNKLPLLILCLSLLMTMAKAQDHFEISTGITFNTATSPSFRDMLPDYNIVPLPGFTIGASKNIIFNPKHHYQLGFNFTNKRYSAKNSSSSTLVSSNYIDIPFCKISTINNLHFEYGLYAAILLWRNYTVDDITTRDENAMIYDFGLRGGLGYSFEHFTVKTVFAFGIVNENKNSGALYTPNRTLSVLLAIPIMKN